jgi:type IV pilus assembly protein PilC
MLLKSGIHIDEALDIAKATVGNLEYQIALDTASRRVAKGVKLAETLRDHDVLFPVTVVRMIEIGEASGNLEEALFYLADFYDAEVDTATKTLATAIEPILLLGIGAVVGFLAISIITPIYSITGSVQR